MKLVKGIYLPDSDTHFEKLIAIDGSYQKKQFDAAIKYIKPEDRGLFIDVGAHVGLWSIMALKNGFKDLLCFEPDKENFGCLNVNLNLLDDTRPSINSKIFPFPLSDKLKMYKIKQEKEDNSGSKVLIEECEFSEEATQVFDDLANLTQSECRFNTFEGFDFEKLREKILIKIDVQGYEAKVVRGMKKFIQEYKPIIIVEQFLNGQPDYEATMILKSYGMKTLESVEKEVILGW